MGTCGHSCHATLLLVDLCVSFQACELASDPVRNPRFVRDVLEVNGMLLFYAPESIRGSRRSTVLTSRQLTHSIWL